MFSHCESPLCGRTDFGPCVVTTVVFLTGFRGPRRVLGGLRREKVSEVFRWIWVSRAGVISRLPWLMACYANLGLSSLCGAFAMGARSPGVRGGGHVIVTLNKGTLNGALPRRVTTIGVATHTVMSLVRRNYRMIMTRNGNPRINVVGGTVVTLARRSRGRPGAPLSMYITVDRTCVKCSLRGTLERRLFGEKVRSVPITAVVARIHMSTSSPTFRAPSGPVNGFLSGRRTSIVTGGCSCVVGRSTKHKCHHIMTSPGPRRVIRVNAVHAVISSNSLMVTYNNNKVPIVHRNGRLGNTDTIVSGSFTDTLLTGRLSTSFLVVLATMRGITLGCKGPSRG